ncbi:PTR2 [Candida oxycetoniae]|uniref:PTR2 n=1 Tax=Candida oxycetoniae TaxID=497107 RepID=A0AAI9WWB1_9ASCO|nr:PTR2 [Candida oxycetoniae]KAI3402559.2 PTR2 [Candida oxycetoniae]
MEKDQIKLQEEPVVHSQSNVYSEKGNEVFNQSSREGLSSNEEVSNDIITEEDEGREPTEWEMKNLKHVGERIPYSAWLVAVVELAERFSYYGLSAPFQNYMQNGPDDKPAGLLSLKQQGATALSYFFQFWCYVTPIWGGYISDAKLGRFATIHYACYIYIVGIFLLFITSVPSITSRNTALGGFIAAIVLIGIATGMIKSNVSPLIADQIPKTKPRISIRKGKKVIIDPSLTIQSIFLTFYMCINIGSLSVMATTELELHVGFWAAYLLPFCFFFIALFALFLGRKKYIRIPVGDKIIAKTFRCAWIAVTSGFKFDEAKPSVHPEKDYPWSDHFVEEVKRALYACKVFVFYPVYWVVYGQMLNNFVSQAGSMRAHNLPNDFLQVFDSISIIVFIPIMERFVYPFIRRFTPLKPISKIFWGFMFGTGAMVYAAVLQHFIYKTGPCYYEPGKCAAQDETEPGNNVHVAIQVPAYCLIAMSEILASVTGLEYAYTKAPVSMKSFIMAIFLFTNAVGAAIGIALSSVSVDPKMVWTFSGLAVSCFIAGILFWFIYRSYNAKEEEWNELEYENELELDASAHIRPVQSPASITGLENGTLNPIRSLIHSVKSAS